MPVLDPEFEEDFGALNIERFNQGVSTQLILLDTMNLEQCQFIKISVEGMEAKVLDS